MREILIEYFSYLTKNLKYSQELNSYILSVLIEIKRKDFSKDSLTLKYIEAQKAYNFELYQNLGDWILFCQVQMPGHLKNADDKYYHAIAQNCYYSCYKILNKQWKLFEELADLFPDIIINLNSFKTSRLNLGGDSIHLD
jgi:hypothetical protein